MSQESPKTSDKQRDQVTPEAADVPLKTILLFDMDGVLLRPGGYHTALQKSIAAIGAALGAPNTAITADQIGRFEALGVSNEWDSLSIGAALTLIHVWPTDPAARLINFTPRETPLIASSPDFDAFLDRFQPKNPEPALDALAILLEDHPEISDDQKAHLTDILTHPRVMGPSITLPVFQEAVLGSEIFAEMYDLPPQLHTESYLLTYDRPHLTPDNHAALVKWLSKPHHAAGVLTNRPTRNPSGSHNSPEGEIGAQLVELTDLPLMGSGLLTWYANEKRGLPEHTYLKPNPVHALSLLGMILGWETETALARAASLAGGDADGPPWQVLDGAHIVVFEDSTNGLKASRTAQACLADVGVTVSLECIGVTTHPEKRATLETVADRIVPDLNAVDWEELG
ncbi:hypothetical protein KQH62_03635 [bacterium]|nr:hypothetical protein [bacterium]